MIPQAVLDQVQDRSDIVTVISQYAPLRKMGRNYKCPCPFHAEKTPSFVVSPDKQIYHCFGCGVGGNVFSFLMKFDKLQFREAVEVLADRCGVILPEDEEFKQKRENREPLYDLMKAATQYFQKSLKAASKDATIWQYLTKRGLSANALSQYNIGYAPDKWDGLVHFLKGHFNESQMLKCGMVLQKDGRGSYDRFRNRLIFPIRDYQGRVIGFGGRVLGNELPKYINSPETEIYHKGRVLYGLYAAREAIRQEDKLLVVEGYTDVVACYEAGIQSAVSSSGTALTVEQIKLMKRFTSNITVLFDSDTAGELATLRGLDLLVEESCQVDVATLPKGHDPDSYVREFGKEAFSEQVREKAKPLFEYKLDTLVKTYNVQTPDGKANIAMEMLSTLRRIPNEVLKINLVQELSKNLQVAEVSLLAELNKEQKRQIKPEQKVAQPQNIQKKAKVPIAESMLLGLLIGEEPFWKKGKAMVKVDDFRHADTRAIAEFVLDAASWEEIQPAQLMQRLEGHEASSTLASLVVQSAEEMIEKEKAFDDCLNRFIQDDTKRKLSHLRQQIAATEQAKDHQKLSMLLQEFEIVSKKGK